MRVQPSRRDRRFADPGWAGKLRRAMQAYLAAAQTAEGVVAEAGLDEKDAERVGFVLTNMIDALAPSNNPLLIVPPQVFMISWRNPDARYAKWDLDTYDQAFALTEAEHGSDSVETMQTLIVGRAITGIGAFT